MFAYHLANGIAIYHKILNGTTVWRDMTPDSLLSDSSLSAWPAAVYRHL